MMRRILMGFIFLILVQSAAFAQGSSDRRGWGYVFGGIGGTSGSPSVATFSVGGGGEGLVYRGFGLGAEVGYLGAIRQSGDGIGILSVNPAYHFKTSSRRLVPFVTGGYSLAFRGATASGGNFGGGVQYWLKDRVGLRLEFRDHVFSSDTPHLFQFRVGLSFR